MVSNSVVGIFGIKEHTQKHEKHTPTLGPAPNTSSSGKKGAGRTA